VTTTSWVLGASYRIQALPRFAWFLYLGVGLPVLIFALIGVWGTIIRVRHRTQVTPEWAAVAGLAIATYILYCVLPVLIVDRYMVALVPSVVLFSAAGVNGIAHRLGGPLPIVVVQFGLALILIIAFCAESFALPQLKEPSPVESEDINQTCGTFVTRAVTSPTNNS
jgi:hypothetical protein